MDLKLVALTLLTEMQNQKLSYDDLRKKTGIPKASLQRYLTGDVDFPLKKYELVCRALSVNPAELLGWDNHDQDTNETEKELFGILRGFDTSEKTHLVQFLKHFAKTEGK